MENPFSSQVQRVDASFARASFSSDISLPLFQSFSHCATVSFAFLLKIPDWIFEMPQTRETEFKSPTRKKWDRTG